MPCLCTGNAQSPTQGFKLSDFQGISVPGLPEDVLFLHGVQSISVHTPLWRFESEQPTRQ